MFKRIIKSDNYFKSNNIETVPINTNKIHPITLDMVNTSGFINPVCLTKFHISNNKLNIYSEYTCNGENKYNEYMHLPPINITSSDLLKLYNINTIDNLKDYINSNISIINQYTLIRIMHCWVINNMNILKSHTSSFINIYNIIIHHFDIFNQTIKINVDKEVKYYIEYWIQKYDTTITTTLFEDLSIYLYNKNKNL